MNLTRVENHLHLLLDCLAKLAEQIKDNDSMQSTLLSVSLSFADRAESTIQISVLSVLAGISTSHPYIIR